MLIEPYKEESFSSCFDAFISEVQRSSSYFNIVAVLQVVVDKQARQLANLTSEVSAWERMIDRRQQYIEHLEKQLSSGLMLTFYTFFIS